MQLTEQSDLMQNFRQRQTELVQPNQNDPKPIGHALTNTLAEAKNRFAQEQESQTNGETGQPVNSDGISNASSGSGGGLLNTGSAPTQLMVAEKPTGGKLTVAGAAAPTNATLLAEYHPAVVQIADSLTKSLPSSVTAWLKACNEMGWQAGNGPERTEEALAQTREAMSLMFRSWRAAKKSPQELAAISVEVVKTLSTYGYGAMPASEEQAKLKVAGFTEVLEDYPIWAVSQAGLWWRKNQKEAPTPKQWADRADIEMGKYAPVMVEGLKMTMGTVHKRVTAWAKGERVW